MHIFCALILTKPIISDKHSSIPNTSSDTIEKYQSSSPWEKKYAKNSTNQLCRIYFWMVLAEFDIWITIARRKNLILAVCDWIEKLLYSRDVTDFHWSPMKCSKPIDSFRFWLLSWWIFLHVLSFLQSHKKIYERTRIDRITFVFIFT